MPKIRVNMAVEVSDQFISDVLTNVVESGGSSYWAVITAVLRDDNNDVSEFLVIEAEELFRLQQEGVSVTPEHTEKVNAERITKTLIKIMSSADLQGGYVWEYIRDGVMGNDAGFIDAEATDFILQICVLDQIIYG